MNNIFNDLQAMYDYYLYMKDYWYEGDEIDVNLQNSLNDDSELFRFVVDYYGYNKFPCVIPTREFNKLTVPELYHGFKDYDYGANFLTDYTYHYGGGYNDGFYLTKSRKFAGLYTKNNYVNDGQVLKVKLLSDNGGKLSDISSYFDAFYNEIKDIYDKKNIGLEEIYVDPEILKEGYSDEDFFYKLKEAIKQNKPASHEYNISKVEDENIRKKLYALKYFYLNKLNSGENKKVLDYFIEDFIYNPSTTSVFLGYDYMIDDIGDSNHVILFNRSAICVPEAEAKRFLTKSKNYKEAIPSKFKNIDEIQR